MSDTTTTDPELVDEAPEREGPVYRYRFTSTQPEELSGLAGELVAGFPMDGSDALHPSHVRGSALVEEGDEIELSVPVVMANLEPVDDATAQATDELALVSGLGRDELHALGAVADAIELLPEGQTEAWPAAPVAPSADSPVQDATDDAGGQEATQEPAETSSSSTVEAVKDDPEVVTAEAPSTKNTRTRGAKGAQTAGPAGQEG